jgi:hydrogenase maturation protease
VRDALPEARRHPNLKVCCVGNRWRSDDAVALAIGELLRPRLPGEVDIDPHESEPTALLDAWDDLDAVWVVDAVLSGASPGTIHRLDVSELPAPAELFRTSTHHVSLAEVVELARALGRLPSRVVIVGIEGDNFTVGEGLSPAVGEAVAPVADLIEAEVLACMKRP